MSELFYALALLACPVAMGAMMWMMMRGGKSQPQADSAADLATMRAEIDRLRAQQSGTNVTAK